MTKSELARYRRRLLALRDQLQNNVESMRDEALHHEDGEGSHNILEEGTELFEQEFTLSLVENEEETLGLIDEALERIEKGTYGICVGSGEPISKDRLDAIPYTPYCVDYAARLEDGDIEEEE
ncbi:Conjugal transfer protein TraR [Planctomycetales bacterium 10988]|nr:Conjugal transfer protein TraR [Planctomycetales bacterium 10988]